MVLLGSAACATSPANHYYLLTPSATTETPVNAALPEITVRMPAYLDRPQIVMERGGGQVELLEFERWAEPVDSMIGRVVRQDMAAHLSGKRGVPDIDLSIDAFTFRSGQVDLRAHWSFRNPDADGSDKTKERVYAFAQTLASSGSDIPGLIAAMSALIDALSQDIILSLPKHRRA